VNGLEALNQFTSRYYAAPAPGIALAALVHASSDNRAFSYPNPNGLARFFGRAAQLDPALAAGFREFAGGSGPSFAALVVSLLDQGQPGDPLGRPIQTPPDLDAHWAEFLLTGDPRPVVRLIDVLEWPDRVRARMEEWLAQPARWFGRSKPRIAERLARLTPIVLDAASTAILTEGDLDCAALLDGLAQRPHDSMKAVLEALPFRLDPPELLTVATKGSALWSLASNARQHPLVRETCRSEAGRRSGKARVLLERITLAAAS
jgi:hypothetical protein